jgi:hypothetical protein
MRYPYQIQQSLRYEFIACQKGKHGVLILSEFAGAAQSLGAGSIRVRSEFTVDGHAIFLIILIKGDAIRVCGHGCRHNQVPRSTVSIFADAKTLRVFGPRNVAAGACSAAMMAHHSLTSRIVDRNQSFTALSLSDIPDTSAACSPASCPPPIICIERPMERLYHTITHMCDFLRAQSKVAKRFWQPLIAPRKHLIAHEGLPSRLHFPFKILQLLPHEIVTGCTSPRGHVDIEEIQLPRSILVELS